MENFLFFIVVCCCSDLQQEIPHWAIRELSCWLCACASVCMALGHDHASKQKQAVHIRKHTYASYRTQLCYFHCYYPICIIRQLNCSHQRCPPLIDTRIWGSWKAALLFSYLKMLALISTLLWALKAQEAERTRTFSLALLPRITLFSVSLNGLPVFLVGHGSF